MRFNISLSFFLLISALAQGQGDLKWYQETENDGVVIQSSFPKGGPYTGSTKKNYNHSYLVFVTRVINKTEKALEISLNFSGDSIAIPNSPDTYMKLFLPSDTMTLDKLHLFSYGITALKSLDESTNFQKTLNPKEDCLFYTVAIFYQTKADAWHQERGGNRAAFILKDQNLIFSMPPQVDSLQSGHIIRR